MFVGDFNGICVVRCLYGGFVIDRVIVVVLKGLVKMVNFVLVMSEIKFRGEKIINKVIMLRFLKWKIVVFRGNCSCFSYYG